MEAFTTLTGPILVLPEQNIDTDQIIPGRYLTTTRFEGLGEFAFADWRFDSAGEARSECVLNQPRGRLSPILVAGRNFGCGSSREHAPRALLDFGFRVVISSEIADIFRSNALNVGLLPIVLPEPQHGQLLEMDGEAVTVDLERSIITLPGNGNGGDVFPFTIDRFARHCLLQGMDRLDFLLAEAPAITAYEERT